MSGIYRPEGGHSFRPPSWKSYQARLQRERRTSGSRRQIRRRPLLAGLLVILLIAVGWAWLSTGSRPPVESPPADGPPTPAAAGQIEKSDVKILLGKNHLTNVAKEPVTVVFDGRPYEVDTSLDIGLQQYLLKKMDRVNSRYIGIVAIQPDTGRVLAMAGFNKRDPQNDPCLIADYPAASLFKIITAAAAVEKKGYTARSNFKFNGYKHTLYKRQLTDTTNRYTTSITLEKAFAQSVNPVFGKLGALYLDRQTLQSCGDAFGFNGQVGFELPWPTSHLAIDDDTYHRAEIASGFNRQTTISPLHGAVIVSTVLNGGRPVEPTLVDRIVDDTGEVIYRSQPRFLPAAVTAKTAAVLKTLMTATITSGTARKQFRGYSRSKVLSRLKLGGKTGSIANRGHDARFDWFVGFASEKKGPEKLVVSVMVAHEEYIGIRAGQYARMAMEHYFKDYFARQDDAGKDSSG
ncbi:penicillin-binding transpeptidase domain-containing protein [Desulfosarcina ovata]|uniref:Penicillin-binding protein transpeptidase domain-containing protein n=1 Tax=Desulfosarcina ovata subsp. ovata TaxID=2752305 RepID=A0A5K8A9V7_9BACT|nr:penicillin-binding transpeptidase domain-containing protein [Desulfosarcina ovata]BBO89347.1 hypothetical protein DSCOOX_25270 [Desulfosarcina ovata subsp. ovata]